MKSDSIVKIYVLYIDVCAFVFVYICMCVYIYIYKRGQVFIVDRSSQSNKEWADMSNILIFYWCQTKRNFPSKLRKLHVALMLICQKKMNNCRNQNPAVWLRFCLKVPASTKIKLVCLLFVFSRRRRRSSSSSSHSSSRRRRSRSGEREKGRSHRTHRSRSRERR